jgi:adenylate kinase family enzyme
MIMGSSGSGKSTMAMRLGEITGLPVVHLDRLSWNPGWIATPRDEMDKKVRAAASQPEWIIDGNYSSTRDVRLERADTVIFLDFSRYICLMRAFKRWIANYGHTRYDVGDDCPERMTLWLIKWIWGYPKRSRGRALEWLSKIEPPKQVYRLKGNKAVKQFLKQARESDVNTQI